MNHKDLIRQYLKMNGSITPDEAYSMGIYRLAARIKEMREAGQKIETVMEQSTNQYGDKVRFARYVAI